MHCCYIWIVRLPDSHVNVVETFSRNAHIFLYFNLFLNVELETLSCLLHMPLSGEDYSRKASCALRLISKFLVVMCGKMHLVSNENILVVFYGYSGFPYQLNWPPWYNWNIVESGVKHHDHFACLKNNTIENKQWNSET